MVKIEDVYLEYLKQKGISSKRPYRLPKDPDLSLEKLRQSNQSNYDKLKTLTDYLNTKWNNIDYVKYLKTGFKLFPTFSYHLLLNDKVLKYYIQLDKVEKFHTEGNRKTILKSFKFIKEKLKSESFSSIHEYCKHKVEFGHECVNDYISGKIDPFTFLYLIIKKYIIPTDTEKDRLVDFLNNISRYKAYVKDEWELFMKMEKSVNSSIGEICNEI